VCALLSLCAVSSPAQNVGADRGRAREILRDIEKELQRKYYDPTFGGKDLGAIFKLANERVEQATSEAQISGIIIRALLDLDDSHTFFIPPPLSFDVEYGFEMGMIGERCHVVDVDAGSLAEADGLRAGMAVLAIEGVAPSRQNFWQIQYSLNVARPRRELKMTLQAPGKAPEAKAVRAKVSPPRQFQDVEDWIYTQIEKYRRLRYEPVRVAKLGEKAAVLRLEEFDVEGREIHEAMESVHGKEALVLDLRDNPGGSVEVLERLVGCLFDREVRIGERKGRKDAKPLVAKRQPPSRVFGGKLVVLVNAASASAAEVTARTVQLERRGTVIGDRTAGAVMVSRQWSYAQGHQYRFLTYGLSITDADLVMSDGRSLEKTGVVPDEVVLPTGEDLASGRDPVLTLAAERVGATLDPEAAGKLFAGTISKE
jgi:C-terminal processing protease CtpA/Prc